MFVFFALIIFMPQVALNDVVDYWKKDSLTHVAAFGKYMSRDRFFILPRMLHFYDKRVASDTKDSLMKIRSIVDHFRSKFFTLFSPQQNLVIDESLILFRGRLAFKQYIKTKRHRSGIKLFVLCDCDSGAILDFILYTGASLDIPAVKKGDPLGKVSSNCFAVDAKVPQQGSHFVY